jgi:hypothetical protein
LSFSSERGAFPERERFFSEKGELFPQKSRAFLVRERERAQGERG